LFYFFFFVFQGGVSESFSLVTVNDPDKCEPANPKNCFTVALYINAELEFINKPVYSLTLQVKVRNNILTFTVYVINNKVFYKFVV
jgi:hypothetical protein